MIPKYLNNKSFITTNSCDFCNDTSICSKQENEIISHSQQTDITNIRLETNTLIINYIGGYYLNTEAAAVILNPTPSLNDNYLWIPETSDNAIPGLDSLITYTQSQYATLTALRPCKTNINNTNQTEINNLEINNQGGLHVNK